MTPGAPSAHKGQAEAGFSLRYEGEQEDAGEISARALAAALRGLVDVSDRASAAGLFGEAPKPVVAVKAHKEGSFEVLAALQWTVAHGVELGALATSAGVLINAITKMVDKFSRVKPVGVAPGFLGEGYVLVTWSDGSVTEHTREEWKFISDARARKATKKLVAPMGTGLVAGPTRLSLSGGGQTFAARAADVEHLDDDAQEEPEETTSVYRASVMPAVVDFDTSEPWSVYESGAKRKVRIEDGQFLRDLDTGTIKIGKTDVLNVRMRLERSVLEGKVSEQRFIEEVLRHDQGATQLALPEVDA